MIYNFSYNYLVRAQRFPADGEMRVRSTNDNVGLNVLRNNAY